MDGAVAQRPREGIVHAAVLVEQRETVELGADDHHLEVVTATGAVLDLELHRSRKRLFEQAPNRLGVHVRGMLAAKEYPPRVRLVRAVFLFTLGFWAGMAASAAMLKRALPSRGDEESDEVALAAIMGGVALKSRAKAFRGGSLLSWFGGVAVDLREAQLAPEAHLDVQSLCGGIAIRVPPGWRIVSNVKALGGGVAIDAPEPETPDAPTLTLDGLAALGGVAVGSKAIDAPDTH